MPAYRAAGYEAMIERYSLDVVFNWHRSFVSTESQVHRIEKEEGSIREVYPERYWPGESAGEQLEFALKYDGINLSILLSIFEVIDEDELLHYLYSKPTGKYTRKIWYMYEFLTGKQLPVDDMKQGNYINLLEEDRYYTIEKGYTVKRQRIRNNLLGDSRFCPIVRRTDKIKRLEENNLADRCREIIAAYPESLLRRALSYLYTKETKSSFEIEHIKPSSSRIERFMALLREAEKEDFCDKERLIALQNRIVDPRFRDEDYRKSQNYVGEAVEFGEEKIHYVTPKPEDLDDLMQGLIASHKLMSRGNVPALVCAAVIAYGFVYLHPFEDGNGRIHRFLIHNILAQQALTPKGIMFPVSAVMLKNPEVYDASLESFSTKLTPLINYTLNEEGRMSVSNDTGKWYRYIDMTTQTEALYEFVLQTIETELAEELKFIANYDRAKKAIQEIVDMPDRQIDLLIRFIFQNHGKLSKSKRKSHFEYLSDKEILQIEQTVSI